MFASLFATAALALLANPAAVRADDAEMITDCATYNATCLQISSSAIPSCTQPKLGFPAGSAYTIIGVCSDYNGIVTVPGYKGPEPAVAPVNASIASMCTDLFVPACQSYPCVSGANVEPSYVCSAATQFTKTFGLCLCPSGLVAIPPFVNPTSTPSLPVASSASDSSAQSVIAMHGIAKAVAGAMVAAAGISTLFL